MCLWSLAHGDARGLLAAVLEGVEREVGEAGNVVLGRVYAKDAALIARPVAVVEVERRHAHRGQGPLPGG